MFSEAWNRFCRRDGTRSPVLNLANFSCSELGNASAVGDGDNDAAPKRGDKIPSLTPSTSNCVEEEIVTSTAVDGADDDFDFLEDDEEMVASAVAVNGDEALRGPNCSLPDDFDFLPTFKELVDMASNKSESTTLNEFLKSKDSWTPIAAPHTYSIEQELVDVSPLTMQPADVLVLITIHIVDREHPLRYTKRETRERLSMCYKNGGGLL